MATVIPFKKRKDAAKLRCRSCGVTVDAACECGVGYAYVPAGELARRAVRASPEKSDRAIAKEIGVHVNTVGRARKSTVPKGTVAKRVGLDGKARRPPKKRLEVVTPEEDAEPDAQTTLHNILLYNTSEAITLAYFRPGVLDKYKPDRQVLQLAREAADEWNKLATYLEEKVR